MIDRAKEQGQEVLERGKQVAQETLESAKETAVESGSEQGKNVADELKATARDVAQVGGKSAELERLGDAGRPGGVRRSFSHRDTAIDCTVPSHYTPRRHA